MRHILPFQLALIACAAASAQTLYVDDDALPGGDGTSWSNALTDLQDALDLARQQPGAYTEIRIAGGVYTPDRASGDPGAVFVPVPHVALRGGFAGTDGADPDARNLTQHPTRLSGDLRANDSALPESRDDNARRVLAYTGEWGVDEPITLDGLIVSGGASPDGAEGAAARFELANLALIDCTFSGNAAVDGGAVRLQYCGPLTIDRVSVVGNTGGGLDADGCWEATISDSTFARNTRSEPDRSTTGGGLWLRNTRITIRDCTISENSADRGGGVALVSGDVTLIDTLVAHNSATARGGGIDAFSGETALLHSRIIGNRASDGAGVSVSSGRLDAISSIFWANEANDKGGALQIRPSIETSLLANCVFVENRAHEGGGVVSQAPMRITHCTVWSNHASDTGGVLDDALGVEPSVVGSILWANTDDTGDTEGAQLRSVRLAPAARSFIQGWTGGGSTSPDDPFVRTVTLAGAPLPLLTSGSPAIDAGSVSDLPLDTYDLDNDGERFETLPVDYLGTERVLGGAPDAGAFETLVDPQHSPDLDGDGVVGPADLTFLLSQWGPCPAGAPCAADFDDSGHVDGADLTYLLSAWTSVALPPN